VPRFFFDVLPLHPRPEPLESLTSYLTRLAALNGLSTLGPLRRLCFPSASRWASKRLSKAVRADLPIVSFDALAVLAACPVEALRATTVLHVAEKFGRAGGADRLAQFFGGSLAPSLRWCPRCLAERPYHSLLWRFPWLTGCPEHGVRLLERCGHCGSAIPVIASLPRIGVCRACGGDLRRCPVEPLDERAVRLAERRQRELAFLLSSPGGAPTGAEGACLVGRHLAASRAGRGMRIADVARVLGVGTSRIGGIENGRVGQGSSSLRHYLAYADYLGTSMEHCFRPPDDEGGVAPPGRRIPPRILLDAAGVPPHQREATLLDLVERAIGELRAAGGVVTQRAVGEWLGVGEDSLRAYPRVEAVLRDIAGPRARLAWRAAREEELVTLVERHLGTLRNGMWPTHLGLATDIGVPLSTLRTYPRVRAFLARFAVGKRARRTAGAPGGSAATIAWREGPDELRERWERVDDPHERRRLHALWLVRCGMSRKKAATEVGVSPSTVALWLNWYRTGSLEAMPRHASQRG